MWTTLLERPEPGIHAFRCEKFVVRSNLYNFTLIEDDYLIRSSDGYEAVGDGNSSSIREGFVKGIPNMRRSFGINVTRRFIEEEHWRIGDDGPGNCDSLPLATR